MSFGSENQKPNPQQPGSQAPSFQTPTQPTENLYPAQGWGAPQQSQQPQGWGAPQPASAPGWGQRPADGPARKGALARLTPVQKGLAAAGIAVVIAGGAGAAVYAATNAANSANAANQGFPGGRGGMAGQNGAGQNGAGQGANGGFQDGPGNVGLGAAGQAVHGEYVVSRGGQYVTELEQSGTISAVSSGKITVKSPDGFEQSYAITSDTTIASFGGRGNRQQGQTQNQGSLSASSLATGQTVRVTALKDGASALSILVSSTTGTSGSSGSGQSN